MAFTLFIISILIPFSLLIVFVFMYCERVAAADLPSFTLAVVRAAETCSMAAAVVLAAGLQCTAAAAGDVKQINWSHCLGLNGGHDNPSLRNLPPKFSDVSSLCRWFPLICSLPQHYLEM